MSKDQHIAGKYAIIVALIGLFGTLGVVIIPHFLDDKSEVNSTTQVSTDIQEGENNEIIPAKESPSEDLVTNPPLSKEKSNENRSPKPKIGDKSTSQTTLSSTRNLSIAVSNYENYNNLTMRIIPLNKIVPVNKAIYSFSFPEKTDIVDIYIIENDSIQILHRTAICCENNINLKLP